MEDKRPDGLLSFRPPRTSVPACIIVHGVEDKRPGMKTGIRFKYSKKYRWGAGKLKSNYFLID
jgi:hypothetical protein